MKAAGIQPRKNGRGLAHRGLPEPSAAELHRLIHVEYAGYRGVADIYDVDPGAVYHWLRKHGIERPTIWGTRRKGMPTPMPSDEELRRRLESGESLTAIASDYGVSATTVRKRTRELGLEVRQSGWNDGRRYLCADGHESRSVYEQRVDDWLSHRGIAHDLEPRYPFDRRMRADFLVGDTYIEVWGVTNNAAYTERRARKIAACAAHGLDLIGIDAWRFGRGTWTKPLQQLEDLAA